MSLFENQSYKTLIKAAVAEGNFGPRGTYDPTDPLTDSPKACVVPVPALLTPPPWLRMNPMRSWQMPCPRSTPKQGPEANNASLG